MREWYEDEEKRGIDTRLKDRELDRRNPDIQLVSWFPCRQSILQGCWLVWSKNAEALHLLTGDLYGLEGYPQMMHNSPHGTSKGVNTTNYFCRLCIHSRQDPGPDSCIVFTRIRRLKWLATRECWKDNSVVATNKWKSSLKLMTSKQEVFLIQKSRIQDILILGFRTSWFLKALLWVFLLGWMSCRWRDSTFQSIISST